jgi:hypothetical protein
LTCRGEVSTIDWTCEKFIQRADTFSVLRRNFQFEFPFGLKAYPSRLGDSTDVEPQPLLGYFLYVTHPQAPWGLESGFARAFFGFAFCSFPFVFNNIVALFWHF